MDTLSLVFPRVRAPQENWKIVTDYDVCAYLATLLLRLYAMYEKSRTILFFLVTFFVGNLGSTFVMLCALSIKGIGEQYSLLSVLASFRINGFSPGGPFSGLWEASQLSML